MNPVIKPLALAVAVAAAFPSVSVYAEALASAPDVIVTANRLPQVPADVLADHVVITSDDIAASGAEGLVDLLQLQRGIEITRNGGPGTTSSVFMRGGNNAQNLVLIDGVRIGSSTTGGATWADIPLAQIDHIEIVYGPLSSLYGADAMGGVIQIFTRKGQGPVSPNASIGAGSYGTYKYQVGVSGALNQQMSFSLNAGHEQSDGFNATKPAAGPYSYNVDSDGYKLDGASGRFDWSLTPDFEIGANFLATHMNAQFDAGPYYDDRSIQSLQSYALHGKLKVNELWISSLQISQSQDSTLTDASYGLSNIQTTQNFISWQNDVRFGTDTLQVMAERRQENVVSTTSAVSGSRSTDSLAAAYVLKRDAHLASASLRYDHSSVYGNNTTGAIAYGYRLTPALRFNASYGTSFRAPTFNELYYPGYGIVTNKPEKAKNAEAGVYYSAGDTKLSAVYYKNKASDLLVSTNVCPVQQSTHPYGCAYNVDDATMSGLTVGAEQRFGPLNLRGSLDLQNPKDDTTGLRLARRAKQHGSLAADYQIGQYKVGAEAIFSGDRFDDVANKKRLAGYSLLNLYGSYAFNKDVSVFARWNNVLNRDYELAKNYNTPGSNVFVGLNYGFK